jgi:spermidine/putrescine transport system substrate-binding protein
MPENALRNMDMTGYVSTIGGAEVLEAMSDPEEYEPVDVSYFFGEEAVASCVNPIMYPDRATVERCVMMHDTDTEALLKMWSRVKGANASAWTYILIFIVLGGLVFAVLMKYYRKTYRRKKYRRSSRR